MMQTFRIKSPKGNVTREYYADVDIKETITAIVMEIDSEDWYMVEHHECYHDEGKPCKQWETVAEKGEVPSDLYE